MPSRPSFSGRNPELTATRMLAQRLKEEREKRGLSLTELSKKVRYDRADLHKMERGIRPGSEYIIGRLEEFYGTGDTLWTLWILAKAEGPHDVYAYYMDLEESARCLHEYAGENIPGLLQTDAYARAQISNGSKSEDEVEALVSARMDRQKRLVGKPGLIYRAILDESIFIRRMSNRADWARQVKRLVRMAELPNVTLQIAPASIGVHDFVGGNVYLLWQPDGENTAYVEGSKVGGIFEAPEKVAALRLSYDRIRDLSFSPGETERLLCRLSEEAAEPGSGSGTAPPAPGAEVTLWHPGAGEQPGSP